MSFSNDLCPEKCVKVRDYDKLSHDSSHVLFPNTYATTTQADLVNHDFNDSFDRKLTTRQHSHNNHHRRRFAHHRQHTHKITIHCQDTTRQTTTVLARSSGTTNPSIDLILFSINHHEILYRDFFGFDGDHGRSSFIVRFRRTASILFVLVVIVVRIVQKLSIEWFIFTPFHGRW